MWEKLCWVFPRDVLSSAPFRGRSFAALRANCGSSSRQWGEEKRKHGKKRGKKEGERKDKEKEGERLLRLTGTFGVPYRDVEPSTGV